MFRTEEGQVCGVHQDRLNEVLNHFYRWAYAGMLHAKQGDFFIRPLKSYSIENQGKVNLRCRHHFERTAKDSVHEEALACFHVDCPLLFMTHEKLVCSIHLFYLFIRKVCVTSHNSEICSH